MIKILRVPHVACFLLSALATSIAYAQADRGSLTGIVLDPTGAPLPQASVEVVARATGLRRLATSDQSGVIVLPASRSGGSP